MNESNLMGQDGDGLEFWDKYSGIPTVGSLQSTELCQNCRKFKPMVRARTFTACSGCVKALQGYPSINGSSPGASPLAMTIGDLAIITENSATYYTKTGLPGAVKNYPRQNNLELLTEVIRNPPPTSFLFLRFGKPTDTKSFRKNHVGEDGRLDVLLVSGNPVFDSRPASIINCRLIDHLSARYPDADWELVGKIQEDMRNPAKAEKTVKTWRQSNDKWPGIFERMPSRRSVETKVLTFMQK